MKYFAQAIVGSIVFGLWLNFGIGTIVRTQEQAEKFAESKRLQVASTPQIIICELKQVN
jgi:hypothetical protein